MKRIALILCSIVFIMFFATPCMSQAFLKNLFSEKKVETSIDSFTGQIVVETKWENIKDKKIWLRFVYQEDKEFVEIKFISGEQIEITPETPLIIKTSSNKICRLTALKNYESGLGNAEVNGEGQGIWGTYAIYSGDLKSINDQEIQTIRLSVVEKNYDINISKGTAKNLKKLYSEFVEAINEAKSSENN